MSSYLKSGLLFLALCTVIFVLFINIIERYINKGNYVVHDIRKIDDVLFDIENSKKLLDLEDFEYIIQPPCNSTFLTWIVTSYAGDAAPRSALRRAYTDSELYELGIKRVFLLGRLDNTAEKRTGIIQAAIRNEADRFHDIVQGNFYEAYRNLTYKHLMGLKWTTDNCNARFIVKQDDDIVVNMYDIIEKINTLKTRENIFAGYVLKNMKPVHEPANKWYVKDNEFRGDAYPEFLSGWLYIIDRGSATKIVRHSYKCKKYFWIDDVFLTGILRQELNIDLIDMRGMYTTDFRYLICCIKGKEKGLKCEFSVGPNGGEVDLQINFRDFAEFCQTRCRPRPRKLSVGKTCVVEAKHSMVQMGSAKIEPVQFI